MVDIPWWYWRSVQTRLLKWTSLLLGGRRYSIELTTKIDTGAHYPELKKIEVNPEMFKTQPADVQFHTTQGLLYHEVGHARYTDSWPEQKDNVLRDLANMLEDERMERCMRIAFPGAQGGLDVLNTLAYRQSGDSKRFGSLGSKSNLRALNLCLYWRWASRQTDEPEMIRRLGIGKDKDTLRLWAKIKPLVEESWSAPDTKEVIRIAREILKLLDLPESTPSLFPNGNKMKEGIPQSNNGEKPMPAPDGPVTDGPGLDKEPKETTDHHSGTDRSWSKPQPYVPLEDQAAPIANKIVELLMEPRPNVRPRADASRGRYRFTQEVRTADTPFIFKSELGKSKRSLALYLLVDWSSSMRARTDGVRLAMMALHLATSKLDIPHAITFFGAGRDCSVRERIETIAPFDHKAESVKPFIAGYEPSAGNEYLFAALDKAVDELRDRPERDKIIIAIHDGSPVWSGREGRDWDLSLTRIQAAEKKGVKCIGLFLGDDGDEEYRKMQRLFPRLINCEAPQLPEKLGRVLVNLA